MPIVLPTPDELKCMSWAQRVQFTRGLVEQLDQIADLYDHLNAMLPAYRQQPLTRPEPPFDPELVLALARGIAERLGPDPEWEAHQRELRADDRERLGDAIRQGMRRHLKAVA